jgi:hypothetical protein
MFYGKGLIIDKDKKRYKKYISFLFFKVGEWESLSAFTFVAITTVMGSQTLNNPQTFVASSTLKVRMYGVYLCIDTKRKVQVMKTKNQQEAVKLAKGVSDYLKIEFVNYIKE